MFHSLAKRLRRALSECRCGHPRTFHTHLSAATYCAARVADSPARWCQCRRWSCGLFGGSGRHRWARV